MTRLACLFAVLFAPGIATAEVVYAGAKNVNHDCAKEPDVVISDGEGNYKFAGACTRISVAGGENKLVIASVKELRIMGGDNTINVDAVDKIAVTGSGNKVTYKKGVTAAKPKVAIIGNDNKVSQVK